MDISTLINTGLAVINGNACPSGKERTVIVLGVPRGGTSLVAGALAEMGQFMGDEAYPPVYEDVRLSRAFEKGGDPAGIIEEYNNGYPTWGFKRPASVDYLGVLYAMVQNPIIVAIFKDIFSIANRDSISMRAEVIRQMRAALLGYQRILNFLNDREPRCLLVSYDKALRYKEQFVDRLADFVGMELDGPQKKRVISFVQPEPAAYLDASRITKLRGQIDGVAAECVVGWASSIHSLDPARLQVFVNDVCVGECVASGYRQDLKDNKIHPKGTGAFRFSFPGSGRLKVGDSVRVRGVGDIVDIDKSPAIYSEDSAWKDDNK